jgi:hypothetical protein
MRWVDVRHISVVRAESSPNRNSRGTTQGVRAKVIRECSSLVCNELPSMWHILQRVHMQVLIICQDEHNVGSLRTLQWGLSATQAPVPSCVEHDARRHEDNYNADRRHSMVGVERHTGVRGHACRALM